MSSLEPPTVPPARAGPKKMRRCLSFYEKLCLISDQILKEKSKNKKKSGCTHSWSLRWWCSPPGGCRLWSGRWRGAAGRTYWWSRGTAGDALCGLEEQKSQSEPPVSAVLGLLTLGGKDGSRHSCCTHGGFTVHLEVFGVISGVVMVIVLRRRISS